MESVPSPLDKLNEYSLKLDNATRKFEEAFQLQKRYKKAVNRMRYEFTASLSTMQKRLLEKESWDYLAISGVAPIVTKCNEISTYDKSPKLILYTVRHYHSRREFYAIKVKQYRFLTRPNADNPEIKLKAAQLAREAVDYDKKWSKYLHYVPAVWLFYLLPRLIGGTTTWYTYYLTIGAHHKIL